MSDHNQVPQRLQRWQEKWDESDIKFHKVEANPALLTHYDKLVLGRSTTLTFLLPLCGKSLDLLWLYQRGHIVIGIEGVEKAIVDFFSEHKIDYEIKKIGPGSVYETADGKLRIHLGDFFDYTKDVIGEVDCVWDRGSLVAVYKQDRSMYAEVMKRFLKPTFHYLLQTLEYISNNALDAPPRSVPCNEVVQLFGDVCNVDILETIEVDKEEIRHIDAPVVHMHNLLLTRKGSLTNEAG